MLMTPFLPFHRCLVAFLSAARRLTSYAAPTLAERVVEHRRTLEIKKKLPEGRRQKLSSGIYTMQSNGKKTIDASGTLHRGENCHIVKIGLLNHSFVIYKTSHSVGS